MYGKEFVEVSVLYGAKIRSALAYWNATLTSEISEAKCHFENLTVFWKRYVQWWETSHLAQLLASLWGSCWNTESEQNWSNVAVTKVYLSWPAWHSWKDAKKRLIGLFNSTKQLTGGRGINWQLIAVIQICIFTNLSQKGQITEIATV